MSSSKINLISSFHLLNESYTYFAHPIFLEIIFEFQKTVKNHKENEVIHVGGLTSCLEMMINHISYHQAQNEGNMYTLSSLWFWCMNVDKSLSSEPPSISQSKSIITVKTIFSKTPIVGICLISSCFFSLVLSLFHSISLNHSNSLSTTFDITSPLDSLLPPVLLIKSTPCFFLNVFLLHSYLQPLYSVFSLPYPCKLLVISLLCCFISFFLDSDVFSLKNQHNSPKQYNLVANQTFAYFLITLLRSAAWISNNLMMKFMILSGVDLSKNPPKPHKLELGRPTKYPLQANPILSSNFQVFASAWHLVTITYDLQNHNMLSIIKLISSLGYSSKHCDCIIAKGFSYLGGGFDLNCRVYQLNLGTSSPKIRLNLCTTYNQHITGISSVYKQFKRKHFHVSAMETALTCEFLTTAFGCFFTLCNLKIVFKNRLRGIYKSSRKSPEIDFPMQEKKKYAPSGMQFQLSRSFFFQENQNSLVLHVQWHHIQWAKTVIGKKKQYEGHAIQDLIMKFAPFEENILETCVKVVYIKIWLIQCPLMFVELMEARDKLRYELLYLSACYCVLKQQVEGLSLLWTICFVLPELLVDKIFPSRFYNTYARVDRRKEICLCRGRSLTGEERKRKSMKQAN
ncbi:hypothetical protein VP01_147g6 [Puccinia sorghi]|uniref:Uncharacterized protein n=1 Tax=Puccinia sorghi TaxID=27349 RepID=A0A0L6VJQ1_9BASI|nr:hypothetical protein VP01_147g6 [Puccinia sorghi]